MSLQPQALKGWPGPLSARNRPNSFAEWVLGCNLPAPFNLPGQGAPPEFAVATAHLRVDDLDKENQTVTPPAVVPPTREAKQKQPMAQPVVRSGRTTPTGKDLRLQLEVYADSLDKTDTMTITLPRPGSVPPRMSSVAPGTMIPASMPTTMPPTFLPAAVYKKVTFAGDLKSALKSPRVIELSTGSSESGSDSDSDSSSSDESSDSDEKYKPRRKTSRHRSKHKHAHHPRRSRSHSCTRRPRASSRSPCGCDSDDFLRDALKCHGHIYDTAARRYPHHSRAKECEIDAVWSDDDDPFYRFADSDTLPSERDDMTKFQAPAKAPGPKAAQPAQTVTKDSPAKKAQGPQPQTCLPVPVPVYYPVGIESGKRQTYGPSIPWKSGPAPALDRLDREPVCLQCRTMRHQGLPQMASPVFNDNGPRFHQDIASDSSGRASNGTDRYYYWTQQPERQRHARSRSVTCNRDLEYPPGWIPSPKEWHSGGANYGYYHYVPESPIAHHRDLEYPPGWQPNGRERNSRGHGYCHHHRTYESPPMQHREIDYAYKPRYPPPPEYNTARYGYQHHPHVMISPARSLGRSSNSTKSYFGNSRYPIPGAWYDPPEAEHKLRDDYKRHRMEVYRREQERLEKERARLDRQQSQDQDRRQAKRRVRDRERESSPPPVWGDTGAAQSRHKTDAGQNTDVVW